jgi:hypothetical protein
MPRQGAVTLSDLIGPPALERTTVVCGSWPMPWSRRLNNPIALKDGRTVATLAHMRELTLSIPVEVRRGGPWRYIPELLKEAAADRASVTAVEEMLLRGLRVAGLL